MDENSLKQSDIDEYCSSPLFSSLLSRFPFSVAKTGRAIITFGVADLTDVDDGSVFGSMATSLNISLYYCKFFEESIREVCVQYQSDTAF